jgi:MFS family permease
LRLTTGPPPRPRPDGEGHAYDRWPRVAVTAVFFVQGLLFASWTAHIPQVKDHLALSDGSLGVALLGAPMGSVLAMMAATRLLPTWGSRRMVRLSLLGFCASGPIVGLSNSFVTFFLAFMLWGAFLGTLDVSMNTQAIAVEIRSARVLMPGFHGSWSVGSLVGAAIGAGAVGLGVSLSTQLLVLASPCLVLLGFLTSRLVPDVQSHPGLATDRRRSHGGRRALPMALFVLGAIAFADMLCEGAAADWASVYLRGSLHAAAALAGLGYVAYLVAMAAVRISGNRLLTRFPVHRALPVLTGLATVGFTAGLLIDRQASILVGFACLGAGLACVVPSVIRAAGDLVGIHSGRGVAAVSAFGWAGFVLGPVLVGSVASATSLRTALFLIPLLTLTVVVATATAAALRGPSNGPSNSVGRPGDQKLAAALQPADQDGDHPRVGPEPVAGPVDDVQV